MDVVTLSCTKKVRAHFALFIALVIMFGNSKQVFAQCQDPYYPSEIVEDLVQAGGNNSTVGINECGEFIIAYEKESPQGGSGQVRCDIYVQPFNSDGTTIGSPVKASNDNADHYQVLHRGASIALSREGRVELAWTAIPQGNSVLCPNALTFGCLSDMINIDFDFDLQDLVVGSYLDTDDDMEASAGVSGDSLDHDTVVSWSSARDYEHLTGLLHNIDGTTHQVLTCPAYPVCDSRIFQWQPCVAMRESDSAYAVVWADAETDDQETSFNIRLQMYASDGDPIGDPIEVNDPITSDQEEFPTSEYSPAVSIDDLGNIVVVWTGPTPEGCSNSYQQIYARRLIWDGESTPDVVAPQFRVDSNDGFHPLFGAATNPTVALTTSTDWELQGKFIIAWNVEDPEWPYPEHVRAQYFDAGGLPVGPNIQVNQATSATDTNVAIRRLANSGQHTLVYGPYGQVVVTWSEYDNNTNPTDSYFTLFPTGYEALLAEEGTCCKADINGDGERNGLDIQPFVDILIGEVPAGCLSIHDLCPADVNDDSKVDLEDVPGFISNILEGDPCEVSLVGGYTFTGTDCNGNYQSDETDILTGASNDCNGNGIPDECEIDENSTAEGGPFFCTTQCADDCNDNAIPDECETDCNTNGVPDDCDIAAETSDDVNSNDIPDECEPDCNNNSIPDSWDISEETSEDCNENGVPDECDDDCDGNNIPDDCELEGNDCNENGTLDVCDIAIAAPFGSLDCNDNDAPDECELVDNDCNENGIPDECDISSELSTDENENNIPDDCEEEMMMRGGEGSNFASSEDEAEAWVEFYEWCFEQEWGTTSELSGSEQFNALVAKQLQLGLPPGQLCPQGE